MQKTAHIIKLLGWVDKMWLLHKVLICLYDMWH